MILYLDTSALLKLYVAEFESGDVRARFASAEPATAVIAYAEVRAGLAAAHRMGRLEGRELAALKRAWEADWMRISRLAVDEERCREAGAMAETYGLRGFDSLHLACFAHLANTAAPEEIAFCCFDPALESAAARWRRGSRP